MSARYGVAKKLAKSGAFKEVTTPQNVGVYGERLLILADELIREADQLMHAQWMGRDVQHTVTIELVGRTLIHPCESVGDNYPANAVEIPIEYHITKRGIHVGTSVWCAKCRTLWLHHVDWAHDPEPWPLSAFPEAVE